MEGWELIAKWVEGSGALFSGEMCVKKSTIGYVVGQREGWSMAMREVLEVFGELEAAAKFAAKRFPKEAGEMVSWRKYDDQRRAEMFREEAVRAKKFNAFSGEMMRELESAMRRAGVREKVWVSVGGEQSPWGNYDGYNVWAMDVNVAKRAAEWICKWERRKYEAAGGKYGGCTYDAQRCYRAEVKENVEGKPAKVFACLRYYSIGD